MLKTFKQQNKKTVSFVFVFLLMFALTACGTGTKDSTEKDSSAKYPKVKENPIASITMNDGTKIEVELYPKVAPNTVANFISLANKSFYNGLTFHRVIPDFMIQGGDPNGNGTGDPGYSIKGEFSSNGVENNVKHERGVISMARSSDPNSGGSQFFIMVADAEHLDGEYAAFGKVIKGMEVVDNIVQVDRDESDKPKVDVVMKQITVDTKGVKYPQPEKVD
ncbi:peptidylprolyl isomerase [Niallia sp. 03133]|uniref:peptidylprolyl isomerase n=1 Tax=Niallia sp. 03133 TaxID=3458060 RepID=UPI0040449CAF